MQICQRLTLDLDGIEVRSPTCAIDPEAEEEIGIMPEELRPLWSYWMEAQEQHHSYDVFLNERYPDVDHSATSVDALKHAEVALVEDFIGNLLLAKLAAVFPGFAGRGLGVREGWKVVAGLVQSQPPAVLNIAVFGGAIFRYKPRGVEQPH